MAAFLTAFLAAFLAANFAAFQVAPLIPDAFDRDDVRHCFIELQGGEFLPELVFQIWGQAHHPVDDGEKIGP